MNFDVRSLPIRDLIIGGILIVVIGNLIYLDVRATLSVISPANVIKTSPLTSTVLPTPVPSVSSTPDTQTPPCASCPAQIDMAMSMIQNIQKSLTVTPVPTKPPQVILITPAPQPVATSSSSSAFVKDYYIPMGEGSGQASDWVDVSGVRATFDPSLYPPIKQVTLEFTGYTPTGNQVVNARLYNDTDAHEIPLSDLSWSGGAYQSFVTSPLSLDTGSKTYSVQLKTQLQYSSFIYAARLHIVLY
jgi:hypothetical protein